MDSNDVPAGPGRSTLIEPDEFRRVAGHFPSGVTIVTARREDGTLCGLTANAFTSVSLVPPLVLVCIDRAAESHDCILEAGTFVVNVLGDDDGERLSRRFAEPLAADKFEGVAYTSARGDAPVLDAALAWMECRIHQITEAGDHTIFVGEVVDADAREGRPLVYYRGGYGRFEP